MNDRQEDTSPQDANSPAPLALTVQVWTGVISARLREILARSLTPLDQARPGDLVSVDASLRLSGRSLHLDATQYFSRLREDASGALETEGVHWTSLDPSLQDAAARAAMAVACHWDPEFLAPRLRALDPDDGEDQWHSALITANGVLQITENFQDEIDMGRFEERAIDQETVDASMMLHLEGESSAHGRASALKLATLFRPMLLGNPVHTKEGQKIDLGLRVAQP